MCRHRQRTHNFQPGSVDDGNDGAYALVKRDGIPAITVMGYNRAVSWNELIIEFSINEDRAPVSRRSGFNPTYRAEARRKSRVVAEYEKLNKRLKRVTQKCTSRSQVKGTVMKKVWVPATFAAFALSACVTINIYFPAAAAEKAADKIIDEVWQTQKADKPAEPAVKEKK